MSVARKDSEHSREAGVSRWDGFHSRVREAAELLKSLAAVVTAVSATGIFLSLIPLPEQHFDCRSRWRMQPGWKPEWRSSSFQDSQWPLAKAGLGDVAFVLGEDHLPTMVGSLDSTETAYRLSFHVANARQVTDAVLLCAADDDIDVYVNGNKVVSEHDSSAGPITSSEIRRHLHTGTNVIAMKTIETTPLTRPGRRPWALVDLTIHYRKPLWWAIARGAENHSDD